MSKIPDPKALLEAARSANRIVEDREWKQYQRYLAKHEQRYGNPPQEPPLTFEQFCAWLREFDKYTQDMQDAS